MPLREKPYFLSVLTLLVVNAVFLVMFLVYDLTLFQVAAVYWWECLWIGIFCALKLLVASIIADPYENRWVHFSPGGRILASFIAILFVSAEFLGLFFILGVVITFVFHSLTGIDQSELLRSALGPVIGSSVLFLIGHSVSFVVNFLVGGEYRNARASILLALPFKRCTALIASIVVAFTAAWLLPGFANTTGFVILLIVFKLAWDYVLHLRERWAFAPDHPADDD